MGVENLVGVQSPHPHVNSHHGNISNNIMNTAHTNKMTFSHTQNQLFAGHKSQHFSNVL